MVVFEDYPGEFTHLFKLSFRYLGFVNQKFWFKEESWLTKYWRFFYLAPCIVVFTGLLIIDVVRMLRRGDIAEISYRLPPFLVVIHAQIKYILLYPKNTEITSIINELGSLWRMTGLNDKQLKDRDALLKMVKICNLVSYWVPILAVGHYLSNPVMVVLFRKYIMHQDSEFLLPVVSKSYPFDTQANWVVYIAIYTFQVYCVFLCVFGYVGIEMILTTLCGIISMEFVLLCEDILALKTMPRTANNIRSIRADGALRIEDIVKKHQILISLSTQLDNVFNRVIFVNLFFVGSLVGFFKYSAQFNESLSNTVSSYVGALNTLLNALYICYYGELLTSASLRVAEASYESLWYKENKHHQTIVLMLIKRSQYACCVTLMGYTPVTLNMFTKVISTTWSYISLMNTMYGDDD